MSNSNFLAKISFGLILEGIKYLIIFLIANGGFYIILSEIKEYISALNSTWVFWSIFILGILLISIIVFQRFNRNIPIFSTIESNFQIIDYEITHEIISKEEYIHKRKYTLKAKRNGLTSYKDKFMWTGGDFQMKSGDNKHSVLQSKSVNVFDTYIIDFDRAYNKNEIIEATVIWNLSGEGKPFISAQIEEPVKKLTLNLIIHDNVKINDVDIEVTQTQGSKRILKHTDLNIKDNKVTQSIKKPLLLHLYQIKWKW